MCFRLHDRPARTNPIIVISSFTLPAGVTLDLTNLKDGATVSFTGTTTFGTKLWDNPLVLLTGTNLKVTGPGKVDGQGAWYWKQGQSVTRPVFFRLTHVDQSTLTGFTLKNSPFRTFSILNSANTQLTGLTLDSSAGDGLAKNTDGFDLSRNNGANITHNTIHNQDDCLAMQSSTNTFFAYKLLVMVSQLVPLVVPLSISLTLRKVSQSTATPSTATTVSA
ncbi:hypothetical protein LEN26_004058, partial [Aphanomyces euteiches]